MSVVICPVCNAAIDTDFEDYDYELNECEQCIFLKGNKNEDVYGRSISNKR